MKIAGISSQKFGNDNYEGELKNHYLYNDKELFEDADLNWYDYGFRNYDPQIGRFPQLDPLTDDYPHYTPFQYAGNEPIANVDLDGLEPFNSIQTLSEVVISVSIPSGAFKLFSKVGQLGGKLLVGAGNLLSETGDKAKVNIAKDIAWVKNTVNTLGNNAKANWSSGNTIIQQFGRDAMDNPLSLLNGGAGVNIMKGALRMEIKGAVGLEKSLFKYRNSRLAGKLHPKTGISFDADGFPDFSKNLYKGGANDVMIQSTGKRKLDFDAANQASGYTTTPKGYTWHHHQTKGRMQLVESGVHSQTGHTGGFLLWQY